MEAASKEYLKVCHDQIIMYIHTGLLVFFGLFHRPVF
jgi:hypothetical protein